MIITRFVGRFSGTVAYQDGSIGTFGAMVDETGLLVVDDNADNMLNAFNWIAEFGSDELIDPILTDTEFDLDSTSSSNVISMTGGSTANVSGGTSGLFIGKFSLTTPSVVNITHEAFDLVNNAGLGISPVQLVDNANPISNAFYNTTGDRVDEANNPKNYTSSLLPAGDNFVHIFSGGNSTASSHLIIIEIPVPAKEVISFSGLLSGTVSYDNGESASFETSYGYSEEFPTITDDAKAVMDSIIAQAYPEFQKLLDGVFGSGNASLQPSD